MREILLRKSLFIFFLFTILNSSYAQTTISGKVTDKSGNPLPSANIYIKDTYDGVSSDINGMYSFTTSESGNQILVASFIGYISKEEAININGKEIHFDFALDESTSSTGTVVISAGSFEASDENKSVMFSSLDITTTGSSADIYYAMSTLPGTQQIGETEGLFVRGGSSAETKTIIDEMIVQKPFYSTVPDIASRGRFSPMLFKGTLFSAGGYSAQYGQALSSALILKSTDLAPDTRSSINLMTVGLGGSHVQRWENTSLSVEAGYYDLTPYFKIQKQKQDWVKIPTTFEGQVIFRHKVSENGMLKVYSSYSNDKMKLNMKSLDNLTTTDSYQLHNDNFYMNSSYYDILAKEWTFFSGISYSKNVDNIEWNLDKIKMNNEMSQAKVTLSRQLMEGSFITFGGEVNKQFFNDKFNQYGRDVEDFYVSGFAETDIFFSNDIAGRFGLRFEKSEIVDKVNLAPRISLAYKLGQYDQVNLAYGQFFQIPEREFLFQTDKLDYEKATHYIANYQYIGPAFTFRVEGYYKDYKNLVKLKPDADSSYNNSGKGYSKGIDVFFRYNKFSSEGTDMWASYTFLDTKRDYRDFPTMATPTFAAPHTFSLVFKQWVSSVNSLFGFTLSYATGRPYYNPNNPIFNDDKTKDFFNLSANCSHLTNLFGNLTVIFFSIDNVFAYENIYSYRYSNDGKIREPITASASRFFFLGIFISLGENNSGF